MISQTKFTRYAADPAAFRNDLIIDADGVARKFGDVMESWQRIDFAALDPALKRCNGRASEDAIMRAYLERPRGHSKTTDIAVVCVWALAFATRPIRGYAFAADKDQARLLRDAIQTIVRLNPWLGEILTVEAHSVTNTASEHPGQGATLTIEASDVGSSYGILPDLIVADELCHWEGDGSLWHSLISSAAKRSSCLLLTISNAGFVDSWQWAIREVARTDPAWHFSRLDGPMASWLTEARLAEQRRMLPPVAFARLWLNQWSTGGGDALTPADIEAAFPPFIQPMRGHDPLSAGLYVFVAGVDLGLTRDCSAVVVLAIPSLGRVGQIRLAHHRLWHPTPGEKINITEIEQHILALDQEFDLEAVGFDPWQAEHMAQRLEAISQNRRRTARSVTRHNKPWMREVPPTGGNLREQASLVIQGFQDRRFALYACEPLKRDLLKLRAEEKSYGIRLSSPRDGDGHGDSYSAFAIGLQVGHEFATIRPAIASAGGESRTTTSLATMNNRAMQRATDKFAHEQQLWADRQEQMRTMPAYLDHPLYQFFKRIGSDRVV